MTDTEKMQMIKIIGNFVADNIAFGREVLAHHPKELSLEIWEFTDFHQVFQTFFWILGVIKVYMGWFLKLDASPVGPLLPSSRP